MRFRSTTTDTRILLNNSIFLKTTIIKVIKMGFQIVKKVSFKGLHLILKDICIQFFNNYSLLSKSESVKFSLIESVIYLFTDPSVQKYFSLTNQLIFTD